MDISSDLIKQFVKLTKDTSDNKKESIKYGTIVISENSKYVKLDGSDNLTPIDSTTEVWNGERVVVSIENHSALVTGNLSSPAARDYDVKHINEMIGSLEDTVSDLKETKANSDDLNSVKEDVDRNKRSTSYIEQMVYDLQNSSVSQDYVKEIVSSKADKSYVDLNIKDLKDLLNNNYIVTNIQEDETNIIFTFIKGSEEIEVTIKKNNIINISKEEYSRLPSIDTSAVYFLRND